MASCSFTHSTGRVFTLTVVDKPNSMNVANNTTSVDWTLTISGLGAGLYTNTYAKVVVNGTTVYNQTKQYSEYAFPACDGSVSGTVADIKHNNDGTKTISFSVEGYSFSYNVQSASGTMALMNVPRASALNSVSMTIQNNQNTQLTTNISKNVTSYYDSLIIKDGNKTVTTIGGIANRNNTINLTEVQRNAIFSSIGTNTSKTFTCYLHTKTSSSGTDVGDSASKNLTATLPNYTINFTTSNVEETVTSLNTYKPSGHSNDTYISNLSKPKYTFTAQSSTGYNYGRSISYKIGSTAVTSPYTINNYTGQSVSIVASDGRTGKSATYAPTPTVIPYFFPTINAAVTRTTPTGSTIDVSVSGTYYDGNGLTNLGNTGITLKYTEAGGTEQTTTLSYTTTVSNHTVSYTATTQLTGMNYQKSVQWSIVISDKLGQTKTISNTVTQGLPVWNGYRIGDTNHFNVNGTADLFLHHRGDAPTDLNNAITHGTYRIGGTYTNAPSSTTMFGILIVYESRGKTWTYSDSSSWIWQELHTTGGTVYTRNGINSSTMSSWKTIPNSLLSAYPVGSVYMSWNSTSPASLFGGTWTQLKNAFIFGINATTGNGTSGNGTGTSTGNVKLTASQSGLPRHYHGSLRWTTSTGNIITANGGSVSGKFGIGWGSNTGQSANIVTSEAGGTSASDNHSHTVPYIAVFVWRRTA